MKNADIGLAGCPAEDVRENEALAGVVRVMDAGLQRDEAVSRRSQRGIYGTGLGEELVKAEW